MNENVLSPAIEARYRMAKILYIWFVPVVIVGIALGSAAGRFGVWVGDNDAVGRFLLLLTALCTVAGMAWRQARVMLTFLVIAAFGGRAVGFLLFGVPGQDWGNRLGAAVQWGCMTLGVLILIQQWDTIVSFRDERRKAGIE